MIDQKNALTIAKSLKGFELEYDVRDCQSCNLKLYNVDTANCWCVFVRRSGAPENLISSSEVIVIAKDSGEVLYTGSSYDEG